MGKINYTKIATIKGEEEQINEDEFNKLTCKEREMHTIILNVLRSYKKKGLFLQSIKMN